MFSIFSIASQIFSDYLQSFRIPHKILKIKNPEKISEELKKILNSLAK